MFTKSENIASVDSCWNRARMDEPVFVLLGRDHAAIAAITAWIGERITTGKNKMDDAQMKDAVEIVRAFMVYQDAQRARRVS